MSFVHLHVHYRIQPAGRGLPDPRPGGQRVKELGQDGHRHHRPRRYVRRGGLLQGGEGRGHQAHHRLRGLCGAPRPASTRSMSIDDEALSSRAAVPRTRRATATSATWSSAGFTEGFYSKPRVDWELLRAAPRGHHRSVRLPGRAAAPAAAGRGLRRGAKATPLEMRDLFGPDSYYLELQDHGIPEQQEVIRGPPSARTRRRASPSSPPTTPTISPARTRGSRTCSCASRWAKRWTTPTGCALRRRNSISSPRRRWRALFPDVAGGFGKHGEDRGALQCGASSSATITCRNSSSRRARRTEMPTLNSSAATGFARRYPDGSEEYREAAGL